MPTRSAAAAWDGTLKEGAGSFKGEMSGLAGRYSFPSRFGDGVGGQSSPEELIAAAHASCIAMALSLGLERAGTPSTRIEAKAACTVERVGEAMRITKMDITLRGTVPGISDDQFKQAAAAAKDGCPVSNALKGNVQISVDAALA